MSECVSERVSVKIVRVMLSFSYVSFVTKLENLLCALA